LASAAGIIGPEPPLADLNSPNPAIVTRRAAQRLPRLALLLFCAAYVLPGMFDRDPWKSADITAFGYMLEIARGHTSWLAPTVGGLPPDSALLPYWLGAAFIKLLGPWLAPDLAARIPFAGLLVLVLMLIWYATYHLARSEAAQPLPFAFGGEAAPVDYARAIADGGLLALIATLGLLQLGHETTPELAQLACVALFIYALAAAPARPWQARLGIVVALPVLAASGAPSIGLGLAVAGAAICVRSSDRHLRGDAAWVAAAGIVAIIVATVLGAWRWRLQGYAGGEQVGALLRELVWFTWPAWPLALWTLWRWRHQLLRRHIVVPLSAALVSLVACIAMGGSDRALLLGLPALAVLAAFALPTLQRSAAAAIDWFSVFFFSIAAATIWVVYVSMQTGVPAQPAINVARLSPGYTPDFSALALAFAAAGTLAWGWLVQWRTGRNRHPLWKSMVLPASGVSLCWLLVMTLLMPPLNHARGYRSLVQRIAQEVPQGSCIAAPGMPRAEVVALGYFGGYDVDAVTPARTTACTWLLQVENEPLADAIGVGWQWDAREPRNRNEADVTLIYRRAARR
jgi:4-amino-4-deoxy-L-arabinose transferase-like glycosyltransferase